MDVIPAITEHVIEKTTYIVETHESENACDTLKQKMEKLIIRDLLQNAENMDENIQTNIQKTCEND